MVNSWGQIPGNCPDFNNILDGNVVKLKKMQQMLQDYSLAQLEHSAKLMAIARKHQQEYAQLIVNTPSLVESHENDIVHNAITQLFNAMMEESNNRAKMGDEIKNKISVAFLKHIPKYASKRTKINTSYTKELAKLKKQHRHAHTVEIQYKNAAREEKKSKEEYDKQLGKKNKSLFGGNTMKKTQVARLELVAITNFAKEDYQKTVHVYNDKQHHVYGEVLKSLCNQQQKLYEEQCKFVLTSTNQVVEMIKSANDTKLTVTSDENISESTAGFFTFFQTEPNRLRKVPLDKVVADHSDGGYGKSTFHSTGSDDRSSSGISSFDDHSIPSTRPTDKITPTVSSNDSVVDSRINEFDEDEDHALVEVKYKVLYDFSGIDENGEPYPQSLAVTTGQILVKMVDPDVEYWEPDNGWQKVSNQKSGETGYVPSSYIALYLAP